MSNFVGMDGVITHGLATIGFMAIIFVAFLLAMFFANRGRTFIDQKREVVDREVDKTVDSEEEGDREYPRLLLLGVPYKGMERPHVEHMMNSLNSGFKEKLSIGWYVTDKPIVEFMWFEHSGNSAIPYPKADEVLKERGKRVAHIMMLDEEMQWQVGEA